MEGKWMFIFLSIVAISISSCRSVESYFSYKKEIAKIETMEVNK